MKRNEIVEKLIKEGFSEKTLVKFTDKQLSDLSMRILGEGIVMISKDGSSFDADVKKAKDEKKTIETYEEKNKEEYCDKCDCVKSKCKCKKSEVKEWMSKLAEENFHSFTSKNEIMELVKTKLNEVEVGPNVKKGHNGIPEFMSYDTISNTEVEESSPTTKPAPTKPKVSPGTKPKTPYQPGPGKNPKPKALKEKENANK